MTFWKHALSTAVGFFLAGAMLLILSVAVTAALALTTRSSSHSGPVFVSPDPSVFPATSTLPNVVIPPLHIPPPRSR